MQFDRNMLKNRTVWAVLIPAVLAIWSIAATANMIHYRGETRDQIERTEEVEMNVRSIVSILKRSGRGDLLPSSIDRGFESITSARLCAKTAGISESRLYRGESPKPKLQKDGSLLHRETFKINGVKLVHIAKFIDYAERSYSSLNCPQVIIIPSRKKGKDSWDATINFEYLKR